MDMPDKDEQNKEHSKISMRIGDVQVEFEGTSENIKKLMDKEMFDFAKKLESTAKQLPPSTESAPKVATKTREAAPKEKTVPPPSKPSITSGTPAEKLRFPLRKNTEKPGKKRIAWKNLAIALVMVCIVLLASLVGVLAFYLPTVDSLNSQVAKKDADIAGLNANVSSLASQISVLQANANSYNDTVTDLRAALDYLNLQLANHLLLNTTEYLVTPQSFTQNASESTTIFQYGLNYAGYVGVTVESSSNTTYVELFYAYKGVNYDQNVTLAESGIAYFPVLPAGVTIKVGNTDTYTGDTINGTVSAIYYY
jgi:cell division protein FtsB